MTFDAEEVPGEVGTWSGALSGLARDCLAALPGFGVILSVFFVFGILRGYLLPVCGINRERTKVHAEAVWWSLLPTRFPLPRCPRTV